MASYTISPIWGAGAQLFDNNGNPLVGGKIYTYYAGSTLPLTTYTDPLGSAANTNPIITNSAGRLVNEIWFPVSGSYKFVLKDANDTLIATYDNIPTTPQPPIVNDASSISYDTGYIVNAGNFTIGETYRIDAVGTTDFVAIGAGGNVNGILFTATGVGSGTGTAEYVRTVENKLRETVSVKDFGAVGNGVTNDTTAIQAALTAGAGNLVYFPAGSYAINAALSVPANTYVYAESGTATVTQSTAAGTNAFTLAGDDITIDGLKIVGPNSGNGSAVRVDSRNNPTVKNCQVQNWRYGIQLRGCKNWTVSGNRLWGGTYDGVSSSDIFIYGSSGAPSSRGILTENFCLSNTDVGISVDTNSGDKDLLVSNNVVFPLQSDGITPLADANNYRRYGIAVGYNGTVNTRAVVSANVVRDVPHSGIYMNAGTLPVGDVAITGNIVSRCGFGTLYPSDSSLRAGIWCNGGADSITGNVVVDCSTAGIKIAPDYAYSSANQPRAVVASNNVARTTGYGIWLTIRPHGYLVTGNRIVNSTNAAIQYETAAADGGNCHFVGNHIDTNTTNRGGIIAANLLGGYDCSVVGNKINGTDNTTNAALNTGIWFNGVVHCSGNTVTKYYTGIRCDTALNARTINLKCSGNTISDCASGISAGGTGPWLVSDNTFDTVTTELNGCAWQGFVYKASATYGFGGGPVIYVADTQAPTGGTWAVGDHCAKTDPAVGQPKGWFCTTAGTPGTWTSEGNL